MSKSVRVRVWDSTRTKILLVFEGGGKEINTGERAFIKGDGCGLPGGRLEPDEDPLVGAHRELIEETGYDADIVPEPFREERKSDVNHTVLAFNAYNPRRVEEHIRDPHVVGVEWVPQRLAFTSRNHKGKIYPIYRSHEPLIQYWEP